MRRKGQDKQQSGGSKIEQAGTGQELYVAEVCWTFPVFSYLDCLEFSC